MNVQARFRAVFGGTNLVLASLLLAASAAAAPVAALEYKVFHALHGSQGASSYAPLIVGRDGNFYGTTRQGGRYGCGTAFKLTPANTLTVLHAFRCDKGDGAYPTAALIQGQGSDDALYGTTSSGGSKSGGTVFKISPDGEMTILHAFDSTTDDGRWPLYAPLIQAKDGYLYGVTSQGGTDNMGIAYRISTTGDYTILHHFLATGPVLVGFPAGPLLEGTDGKFYGTSTWPGNGTVYRMTQRGVVSVVRAFAGAEPSSPLAGVIQGADGHLYGTSNLGGAADAGTVFKVTRKGQLTVLASFPRPGTPLVNDGGAYPVGQIFPAADGSIFGTTSAGGRYVGGDFPSGGGAVFQLSPDGQLTTIHSFGATPSSASIPYAGLVLGNDGKLYGTTLGGGKFGQGVVFSLSTAAHKAVAILSGAHPQD